MIPGSFHWKKQKKMDFWMMTTKEKEVKCVTLSIIVCRRKVFAVVKNANKLTVWKIVIVKFDIIVQRQSAILTVSMSHRLRIIWFVTNIFQDWICPFYRIERFSSMCNIETVAIRSVHRSSIKWMQLDTSTQEKKATKNCSDVQKQEKSSMFLLTLKYVTTSVMNSNFIGQKVVKSIPVINDVKNRLFFFSLSLSRIALRCLAAPTIRRRRWTMYRSFLLSFFSCCVFCCWSFVNNNL